jgi:hypothetical protein
VDAPLDLVVVADGGGSAVDLSTDAGAADSSVTEAGSACSLLEPIAGLLTERRTRKVLFTKDQSAVILLTVNESVGDEVLVVSLPGGEQIQLRTGVADMEWLGTDESSLLLTTIDGTLVVAPADGRKPRQIADGVCAHATSPDGLVVYALRDCEGLLAAVDVIDIATSEARRVAQNAVNLGEGAASIVVSPGGSWAAFRLGGQVDAGVVPSASIATVGRNGATYALLSSPGGTDPKFVSDAVLVFAVGADEIRGHVPGSGDKSYLIGKGYDYGPDFGYRISPDGKLLLAAKRTSDALGRSMELHALNVDGSGGTRVADDLYDDLSEFAQYRDVRRHYLFGFNYDGSRILYLATQVVGSQAMSMLSGYGHIVAVDPRSGTTARISHHSAFVASPFGSEIVAIEYPVIVELLASAVGLYDFNDPASSLTHYLSFDISKVSNVAFTPDRRGFVMTDLHVFGNPADVAGSVLWYFAKGAKEPIELGSWQSTYLPVQDTYNYDVDPRRPYPVDPTSCFVIVDTDFAPGPGTLLKLLPQ